MKIASRFPIKESTGLLSLIALLHLSVFVLGFFILGISIQYSLLFISLIVSYHFSLKQLKNITEASDDLCWTGDQWLISMLNENNQLSFQESIYLELLASSWITSEFCFLKFQGESIEHANRKFAWFFSASNLGDRLYRELCFFAKQAIREETKRNIEKKV